MIESRRRTEGRSRTPLFGLALVPLLVLTVLPRVQLFQIQDTFVRLEDLVLAILACLSVRALFAPTTPGGRAMLGCVAVGIFSAVLNSMLGVVGPIQSLLYALRPLEYWAIFAWLVSNDRVRDSGTEVLDRFLLVITWIHVAFAGAQLAGVVVGYSKFSNERGAGLTAGPYELGAVTSMLAVYWLGRRRPLPLLVSVVGLLMSASRVSVAATVIAVAFVLLTGIIGRPRRSAIRVHPAFVSGGAFVAALALAASFATQASTLTNVADRLEETNVIGAWQHAELVAAQVPQMVTSDQYVDYAYNVLTVDPHAGDASASIRFVRWHVLINRATSDLSWLWGLGPSFAGLSVDGGLLRIFVETGVMGLLAWTALFVTMWRSQRRTGRGVLLAMLVGSLFIDLPFAMRVVMMLLLLLSLTRSAEVSSGK